MSVATNLRRLMIAHDLTPAQLAERSGVSKANIGKYLDGRIKPASEVLTKLSAGLGCAVEELERVREKKTLRRPGNMTTEAAAERLGIPVQTLRIALQRGMYPFGVAILGKGGRYSYQITPERFEAYLRGELTS